MIIHILCISLFILLLIFIIWRYLSTRYSLPCPTWLSTLVERDNPFVSVSKALTIIENAKVVRGMTVLDAGCGPGRVAIPLAQKVGPEGHVIAMDMQEGMLSRVKQKAAQTNIANIEYLHAGLGQQKLQSLQCDRILLVMVLGEIPNQEAALKELFTALKPGGLLSITEIIFDPHFQRRSKIENMAKKLGFEVEENFGKQFAYTINLKKPLGVV